MNMTEHQFTLRGCVWARFDVLIKVTPEYTEHEEDPLSLSIEKWEFIVKTLREHPRTKIDDGGTQTCALCVHYPDGCEDCPVMNVTGEWSCRGTPYSAWLNKRSLTAAQAELKFLQGLRKLEEDEHE
jgi:hypothetical protein